LTRAVRDQLAPKEDVYDSGRPIGGRPIGGRPIGGSRTVAAKHGRRKGDTGFADFGRKQGQDR
jgi:hypothetical protein